MIELFDLYAIQKKVTKMFLSFGSKCAWTTPGNARKAWAYNTKRFGEFVKFDKQDEYVIVSLDAGTRVYSRNPHHD